MACLKVMKIEADECRAALMLIRRAIEEHCPPGVEGISGERPLRAGVDP